MQERPAIPEYGRAERHAVRFVEVLAVASLLIALGASPPGIWLWSELELWDAVGTSLGMDSWSILILFLLGLPSIGIILVLVVIVMARPVKGGRAAVGIAILALCLHAAWLFLYGGFLVVLHSLPDHISR